MTSKSFFSLFVSCGLLLASCSDNKLSEIENKPTQKEETPTSIVPIFDEHDAYNNIAMQVSFGPRVPNTPAQINCAKWLQEQLDLFCDTVYRQETTVTAGDGTTPLRCINLIGAIRPEATQRILLLAHWDTRPWADRDENNQHLPIDGADDGASGVGVLLTIAKTLSKYPLPNPHIGIDILFVDVEDYGKTEWGDESYAIGTRYWANNTHLPNYTAQKGILLDMVGGVNANFSLEGYSRQYAADLQKAVWAAAGRAGYSSYFVYQNGPHITDDHVPVNQILGIPTIDIINLPINSQTGFVHHWHTHNDNMESIDKQTLKAVGQTVLQYLYDL